MREEITLEGMEKECELLKFQFLVLDSCEAPVALSSGPLISISLLINRPPLV